MLSASYAANRLPRLLLKRLMAAIMLTICCAGAIAMPAEAAVSGPTKVDFCGNVPVWTWSTEGKPKAVVLCLHELALHAGVFDNFARKLVDRGMLVYSMDLRGFGEWQNEKGKAARMSLKGTLEDTRQALVAIRKKNPGLPVFVLGEAMGGAMALKVASTYPDLVNGVISACPGGEHFQQTSLDVKIGRRLVTGAQKKFDFGKQWIEMGTAKPDLRELLQNDKKVRLALTPKELMQCQFFMYKTGGMARKIKSAPVMIVQGELDKATKPSSAQKVYNKLSTPKKKLLMVPDGDHFIFEDRQIADKIADQSIAWIDQNLTTTQ